VAPINGEGIEPLQRLIPQRVRRLTDIPKTLIFHDAIDPGIRIADELAGLLPRIIQGVARDQLVTAYYASIDKRQKKKMLSDFREGTTRIMICTDAFGLGVNIPDVERVIQWHVDEKFTL
jgi:superfamily II DNA/RNA helicase